MSNTKQANDDATIAHATAELESFYPNMIPPMDIGEAYCVLDAIASGDDPGEHLDEWRFWHSPHGRQVEAYESFESGRY